MCIGRKDRKGIGGGTDIEKEERRGGGKRRKMGEYGERHEIGYQTQVHTQQLTTL